MNTLLESTDLLAELTASCCQQQQEEAEVQAEFVLFTFLLASLDRASAKGSIIFALGGVFFLLQAHLASGPPGS